MKFPALIAALAMGASSLAVQAADVATVNGKGVGKELLDAYMAEQGKEASRDEVLKTLVLQEILLQEADKQKLAKRTDVKRALEMQRRTYLSNLLVQEHVKANPVTEKELKEAYDQYVGDKKRVEFNASHILLASEEEAKAVIKELNKGGDFAELAKKKSTGPTGKNGGSLGWFQAGQMVPPFSAAVAGLKKGEMTKEPVRTQFGWHVIQLNDRREVDPPSLDQVRQKLTAALTQQRVQKFVAELHGKAKIEMK